MSYQLKSSNMEGKIYKPSCNMWKKGAVSTDFTEAATIVNTSEKKGDRAVTGKILARIIANRLQRLLNY